MVGELALVSNFEDDTVSVLIIDGNRMVTTPRADIGVGASPIDLAIAPSGELALVSMGSWLW